MSILQLLRNTFRPLQRAVPLAATLLLGGAVLCILLAVNDTRQITAGPPENSYAARGLEDEAPPEVHGYLVFSLALESALVFLLVPSGLMLLQRRRRARLIATIPAVLMGVGHLVSLFFPYNGSRGLSVLVIAWSATILVSLWGPKGEAELGLGPQKPPSAAPGPAKRTPIAVAAAPVARPHANPVIGFSKPVAPSP